MGVITGDKRTGPTLSAYNAFHNTSVSDRVHRGMVRWILVRPLVHSYMYATTWKLLMDYARIILVLTLAVQHGIGTSTHNPYIGLL